MSGLKGIDISVWQSGFTNFEPFKNAGYGYVICKISEGQSIDKCFEQHYGNCTKSNIPVGVYVFSHATNTSKARAEAEYALKILNGRKLGLPIFMDLEASDINYGWNVDITPVALAFGEIIKKAGYKWGVYANQSWLINKLKVDALREAGAMIWCAKYSNEKPTVYCDIWQYSDNGTVPGFSHKVDMNITMTDVLNSTPVEIPQEEIKMDKNEAIAKLVACAKSQVGYLEKRSNAQLDDKTANAGSNNWNKYARDIDNKYPEFYNGKKNGYSWCDIFVDWCFIECFGYEKALKMLYQPTKSTGAGCSYSAGFYRAHNAFYRKPQVGDQVFFGDYGNEGHTGIVVAVNGNVITTVEGNTSGGYGVESNGDGVYLKKYNISTQYIPGFGRPNWGVVSSNDGNEEVSGTVSYPTIKLGSKGSDVKKAQQLLIAKGYSCGTAGADGDFGAGTYNAVKKFQADNGLEADGIVGANTWAALLKTEQPKPETKPEQTEPEKKPEKPTTPTDSACIVDLPIIKQSDNGFPVIAVQTLLGKHNFNVNYIDGDFGPDTLAKVKAFQKAKGLTADGIVGRDTWTTLLTNK